MDQNGVGARVQVGLQREPAAAAAIAVGLAVTVFTAAVGVMVLHNDRGPFGPHVREGLVVGLAGGGAIGVGAGVGAWWLAVRSWTGLVVAVSVLIAAGFVLRPVAIDSHESFVDRPNDRYSCLGWTFQYYPAGVMDGSTTDYCIGIEKPIPR